MDLPNQKTTSTTAGASNAAASASNRRKGSGGSTVKPACAACRCRRLKCGTDCPLAPYFPAGKESDFVNVNKLFGVRNVIKILKTLKEHQKADAMNAFIYESNVRADEPIGGCVSVIRILNHHINMLEMELRNVHSQLDGYRRLYGREPMPRPEKEPVQMMGGSSSDYTFTTHNLITASEQGNVSGGGGGENTILDGPFAFDLTDPTVFSQDPMPDPGQPQIEMMGGPFPDYTNSIAASEQGNVSGGGGNPNLDRSFEFNRTEPSFSFQETTSGGELAKIDTFDRAFSDNVAVYEQGLNPAAADGGGNINLDRTFASGCTDSQQYGPEGLYGYDPMRFDPPISFPQLMPGPERVEIDSMGRPIPNDQSVDEMQRDDGDPKKKRRLN